MPRRKYGRLQKAVPPTPQEKCRACLFPGPPCPVHGSITKKEREKLIEARINKKKKRSR